MLSEFAKVFEESPTSRSSSFFSTAPESVFSIVNKSWQIFLWYCGKKQIGCRLAWHWWNSTDLGLIDMFYAEIVAPQAESGKYFQIWFSPDLGEKMAAFWACACKLSWTLFSPAWVQPLNWAGRNESSGTGLLLIRPAFIIASARVKKISMRRRKLVETFSKFSWLNSLPP